MAGKTSTSITAQQFTKNWQGGMTQSVPKIQEGVRRVTDNPMAKAAAASDKYLNGVQQAVASGKFSSSLLAVDFNTWKTNTIDKVGSRLSGGVNAATSKMEKFGAWLLPTVNAGMQKVSSMPNMTLEDNINRMVTMVRHMAENGYKK